MDNTFEYPPIKKSPEELKFQTQAVSADLGISVVSPTMQDDEIYSMSEEEIKQKYPERYNTYLALRRNQQAHEARRIMHLPESPGMQQSELLRHRSEILRLNLEDNLKRREASLQNLSPEEQLEHKELQDWQVNVYEALSKFITDRMSRKLPPEGYIQLPTGTGKTVLFSDFVVSSGLKSLIVVPNEILLQQTYKELTHIAEKRGVDLDDIGKFYGDEKRVGNKVTVAIYNSLANDSGKDESVLQNAGFGLVVLDEAHRGLTDARMRAVEGIPDAVKIGFTATPKFDEEKQVRNLLNTEIYKMTMREAVEKGLLAPPDNPRYIRTSIDLKGVKTAKKDGIDDYDVSDLAKRVNVAERNKAAVNYYLEAEDVKGKTAVAYCVGVQHATDLAQMFNDQGVPAAVVSGLTPLKERVQLLKDYHEGKIKVLCNADLLIEGFNEQRASVCLNLRPTKSWIIAEQRAGRVLRKDPDDPDKYAIFVELIDEYEEDDEPGKRPILVEDIYGGGIDQVAGVAERTASVQKTYKDKEEGQPIDMGNGVEVAFYTSYEASKQFVSSQNETEGKASTPWMTEEEVRNDLGITEDSLWNGFIAAKLEFHPEWQRERVTKDGQKVVEYNMAAFEEAALAKLLPIVEELNDKVFFEQKRMLITPQLYVYFRSRMERSRGTRDMKEFLQLFKGKRTDMSDEEAKSLAETIDQSKFVQELRDFQNTYKSHPTKDNTVRDYILYLTTQGNELYKQQSPLAA